MTHRCSQCDVNWPYSAAYETCPTCKGPTWESKDNPLAYNDAKKILDAHEDSRKRHEAFERYYEEQALRQLREDLANWAA